MNYFNHTETFYLRPSRTIELLVVSKGSKSRVYFVYNYEGYHFRFFESFESFNSFFKEGIEPKLSFDDEFELDEFILHKLTL